MPTKDSVQFHVYLIPFDIASRGEKCSIVLQM